MSDDDRDPMMLDMLRDIKDSTKHIERKVSDLEISYVKQAVSLENQVKRTDALEKLVLEVRAESKGGIDFLRKEVDDKLKPSVELHKNISGFWTVIKWGMGLIVTVGGSTGAIIAMIRIFGH